MNCCPDCGSSSAVPKEVAWDASCTVPPKTLERIILLENVLIAARNIGRKIRPGDVTMYVPVEEYEILLSLVDKAQKKG